jgi:GMP reductase
MIILDEIQLDFKDVLIKPQKSNISSRAEVDLTRTFKFKHSPYTLTSIPIVAANMTGIGTISLAKALSKHKCMTALHKHYPARELIQFFLNGGNKNAQERFENPPGNTFYSMGITQKDIEKFEYVLSKTGYWNEEKANGIKMINIDVANGGMQVFIDFCKMMRDKHPNLIIMAGNVVSGEMTRELLLNGVDVVKCGISGGCFVSGTQITTSTGYKNIEDIKINDIVLTHTASWKKVSKTFIHEHHKKILKINERIKTTPNHEFYVVHKKYLGILNDDNIDSYAKWVSAEELSNEFLMLELNTEVV